MDLDRHLDFKPDCSKKIAVFTNVKEYKINNLMLFCDIILLYNEAQNTKEEQMTKAPDTRSTGHKLEIASALGLVFSIGATFAVISQHAKYPTSIITAALSTAILASFASLCVLALSVAYKYGRSVGRQNETKKIAHTDNSQVSSPNEGISHTSLDNSQVSSPNEGISHTSLNEETSVRKSFSTDQIPSMKSLPEILSVTSSYNPMRGYY